jgi:hypothetical protein
MRDHFEGLETRVLLSSWYVSASGGSLANSGTFNQPFLTIQQAANIAMPGDTVFIRGGTYHETVVPAHSGTASQPITYQPYNGEPVTIDGADPLAGWSLNNGSVYQANLGWDLGSGQNQVFVDGQMMTEARWPNTSLDPSHPTFALTTSATSTINNSGLSTATIGVPLNDPAGTWVGATIHISPGPAWVMQVGTVIASSPGSLTYSFQNIDSGEAPIAGNRFYLSGLFRQLDSPGEWYRDNNGNLYLWTPQSDNPATHSVEVKHRQYGFDLSGDSYININGVNLFACTINTSSGSTNNTITGISASYVSQFLNNLDPWNGQLLPHTTGIILNGSGNVLQNSTIHFSSGDGVFVGGSGNSVLNCVIGDTDYGATDAAGISVLGNHEQIIGNTIYNAGRSGIEFRDSGACQILHNVIHDVGLQETDLGGFYTYATDGQGTEIAYNLIYNIHTGGFGAAGIYIDNFSSNFVVDHNVVWNTDFSLKLNPPSTTNSIYNNTLVGNVESLASSGNESMPGTVVDNNIFTSGNEWGVGANFSNNIYNYLNPQFVDPAHGIYQLQATSPAIDRGLVLHPYTNGYNGWMPDIGAYEFGNAPFTAGSNLASFASSDASSLTYLKSDTATAGSWGGVYGGNGYDILGAVNSFPSYAQVNVTAAQPLVWDPSPSALTAPQLSASTTNRIASADSSAGSFTLDINLTDGNTHQVALYMLDYDNRNRSQSVQVIDASTGAVLDTENVTNFAGGQYLVWNLSGHVKITITNTGGPSAVASGLFFDSGALAQPAAPSALFTHGHYALNWLANSDAGVAGYDLFRSSSPNGPFVQVNSHLISDTWYTDTTAPAGVNSYYAVEAIGTSGLASTPVFDPSEQQQTVVTPATVSSPATLYLSAGILGVAMNWTGVSDPNLAGYNLFRSTSPNGPFVQVNSTLDPNPWYTDTTGPGGVISYYQVTAVSTSGVSSAPVSGSILRPVSTAAFVRSDTTTGGSWGGVYGADGYTLLGSNVNAGPAYAQVSASNQLLWTWANPTTDPRAMQSTPTSGNRIAACDYSYSSFTLDVNLTDYATHRVALYMVDYDSLNRAQTVQVTDAVSGAVLDTRIVSNFTAGQYLVWNLSGHVKITITHTGGQNAVASGLLFDPAG